MQPSIDKLINWFESRKGKTFYSMAQRNGQVVNGKAGYDCSSSIYYALIEAGFLPAGHRIGNTDSLFNDLEANGWVRTSSPQRGSIFIWGTRGQSGGAAGHTGAFTNPSDVIHCAAFANGITSNNYSQLRGWNGNPVQAIYTYTGSTQPYEGDDDQNLDVGSMIRFDKTYTVNAVELHGGIWQVRNNELCRAGFTWNDNGIPAEPLVEVDADGYATPDQNLDPGSKFVIPGKFEVLELGMYQSYWLALISWNGLKFWVDVETATEIKRSDPGRSTPSQRPPAPAPQPPTTGQGESFEAPKKDEPKEVVEPEPPIEEPIEEEVTKPQEEPKMAYTEQQIEQLKVASSDAQDIAQAVSESEVVKELVSGVSKRTKFIVYLSGDSLIGLGMITPGLAVAFNWGDMGSVVALSGVFATAGAFLLTMFGIYKSNKK